MWLALLLVADFGYSDPGAPQYLVRYTVQSMPLMYDPRIPYIANGDVGAGQQVRVHDILPGAGLKAKLGAASGDTILPDLLDPTRDEYWAYIEKDGVYGYVPLYSLLLEAPQAMSGNVRIDASFGKLAREANKAWTEMFSPPGCAQDNALIAVPTKPGDCWYVSEEWGWGQTMYSKTCDDVWDLYHQAKQKADRHDMDCYDTYIGVGTDVGPDAWTDDCRVYFDQMFVEYPEPLYLPNFSDFRCGEYPIGKTHWDHTPQLQAKKLLGRGLWQRHFEVRMKRDQHGSPYSVASLSDHGAMTYVASNDAIDSQDLWLALDPREPTSADPAGSIDLRICAYLPGSEIFSPQVRFEAKDTPRKAIQSLRAGNAKLGQLHGCLSGTLRLSPDWQPQLIWTDISALDIDYAKLTNMQFEFAPWVTVVASILAVALPAIEPVLGAELSAAITAALVGVQALPQLAEHIDETLVFDTALRQIADGFLASNALAWLQTETDSTLANAMPRFAPIAKAACAAVCPTTPPEGSPWREFCTACNAFANAAAPFTIEREPGSAARGCYGTEAMFTPAGKTTPGTSPWWYDDDDDKGCMLSARVTGTMEKWAWGLAGCAIRRANDRFNHDLPVSANDITGYCNNEGRDMLRHYFGTGEDVKAFIENKYPGGFSSVMLGD